LKASNDGLAMLCGQTNHLTNFAILFSGGGGTGALDDPCKAGEIYMMHSFNKHMIVMASVTGAVVVLMLLMVGVLSFTSPGRKLLYGSEGSRVRKARDASMQASVEDVDEGGLE
jgi:hypothetical protein